MEYIKSQDNLTIDNVSDMVKGLLKRNIQLVNLKNDDLNRHLVYSVVDNGKSVYVIKIFNRFDKWNNEVKTLELLNKNDVKAPKLIKYGSNNINYILSEYVEGNQMSKIFDGLSIYDQNKVVRECGAELGRMHSICSFNSFGEWGNSRNTTYYQMVEEGLERTLRVFVNNKNEDIEIMKNAANQIEKNEDVFMQVKQSNLCHKDFQPKNLLIGQDNKLRAIIDFESSVPWCKEYDFSIIYHRLLKERPDLEKSFIEGYKESCSIDDTFKTLLNLHLILEGLKICRFRYVGWDPGLNFYKTGMDLIKSRLE